MVCALLTQDYVSKLTHLLLATEGDSSGAARRIIHELVEAQRWAVQALARNDRHSMMRMSVEMKRGPQAQQALQLMQARRSGDTARRSLRGATAMARARLLQALLCLLACRIKRFIARAWPHDGNGQERELVRAGSKAWGLQ